MPSVFTEIISRNLPLTHQLGVIVRISQVRMVG